MAKLRVWVEDHKRYCNGPNSRMAIAQARLAAFRVDVCVRGWGMKAAGTAAAAAGWVEVVVGNNEFAGFVAGGWGEN